VDLTVAIATYGSQWWMELAHARPIPSCQRLGLRYVYVHGETLHDARNAALAMVDTEWVVHLDGDDELTPGFVPAMAAGWADVRAPAVEYISPGGANTRPKMPKVAGHTHDCDADCLAWGNWIVVGAVARTALLQQVRWRDYSWSEDWDLWLRCAQAGATFQAIPEAVYRAHVRRDSRNRIADRDARLAAHRAIATANGVPVP